MRVCLIAKYPPIEGGESAKCYWLAKALGERGHEIHIVTNAYEVENMYREQLEGEDLDNAFMPKGVYVHSTDPFIDPDYIPYTRPYTAKLASLAVDVIRQYDLQLIDSWYVLPYVISGFLAKVITGKPQIMRHAGSDMRILFASPYLHTLFAEIFKRVDKIVTYPVMEERFLKLGIGAKRMYFNRNVSVDTKAFNPKVAPLPLSRYINKAIQDWPIITYIGKLGMTKGIYELAEAASMIHEDFLLLFVTNGKGLERFKKFVKDLGLYPKTAFMSFLPPWKIPNLIKRSNCIVVPERGFPVVEHTPILPREVMAVGKCLIVSKELYSKGLNQYAKDGEDLLVINSPDLTQLRSVLERVIRNPEYAEKIGQQAFLTSQKRERFDLYIKDTIKLYHRVLHQEK